MTLEAFHRVWEYAPAEGAGLLLLMTIGDVADGNGRTSISIKRMAQRTRLSEQDTRQLIQKMEATGHLRVHGDIDRENIDLSILWEGWEGFDFGSGSRPVGGAVSKDGYIYLVATENNDFKIGRSHDIPSRLKAFSTQPPFEYDLIHAFEADNASDAEKRLHNRYQDRHIKGEWFRLSNDDVAAICRISAYRNRYFFLTR